ncbi:uncharacterized protein [Chironomus tepperi]|uniref:uncharacterized protein n=1 Tax=Chironomus tepperi TaxID=113505 RepID=UPI00391F2AF5
MQLLFEDGAASKLFYKVPPSNQFEIIERKLNFKSSQNFSSFLCDFLHGEFEDVFEVFTANSSPIKDSFLILRFLRTLDFNEEFFTTLILKYAAIGSKADFQAAVDAPFEETDRKLSAESQRILSTIINGSSTGDDDDDEASSSHSNSVLLTAVEHKNKDVISYLTFYWFNLIQKLPFSHQVRISTVAFETDQLDVLCDLLDYADFPFPEYFKYDENQVHERLHEIIKFRAELKTTMLEGHYEDLEDMIMKNSKLKIIYSINNNSLLQETVNANKLGLYYFLIIIGLKGDDCSNFIDNLSEKEKQQAMKKATKMRNDSFKSALPNSQQSVINLCIKSLIHNTTISKEVETNYRSKIRIWYEKINEIAPEVLDVAFTCDGLKIIYDFESETADNVSVSGTNSPGITFVESKWIFIGSKLSGRKRENEIIGVLAQQICYYALNLVYENGGKPYYNENHDGAEIFDNIVKSINQWSGQSPQSVNDECCGIISSAFIFYSPKEYQMELILRVINLLTEFSDDEGYLYCIKQKYRNLFNFWYNFVVPEFKRYLQKDKLIIRLNAYIDVLSTIKSQKIELTAPNDFKEIFKNNFIIITTNVPTLLWIDIYKHLKKAYGCLLDTRNIFVDLEKFNNESIRSDYQYICRHNSDINVFVDCSKGKLDLIELTFANKKNNFVFVVSNVTVRDELVNVALRSCGVNPKLHEMNYNWQCLTKKSQKLLLKIKINFQNNEKLSLLDVLGNHNEQHVEGYQLSDIIDDQLLNMLLDGHKVEINSNPETELIEKRFEFLFCPRNFIKKEQDVDMEDAVIPQFSTSELIKNTMNKHFILISDEAGSGKSWAIKNISKLIHEKFPTKWVTFVDLKQYIKHIRRFKEELEFSKFLTDVVLRPKFNFESKIFKKLYENGKICIIFDGYDEVAPEYAILLLKLLKSFNFNNGNQMWITIRDYMEVDLLQALQIDVIYKLDKFSRQDGVNLIAKSWILNDRKDLDVKNFDEIVKTLTKLEIFKKIADNFIKKVENINKMSMTAPEIYQMIADTFKDTKRRNINVEDPKMVLNIYMLYQSIGIIFYRVWSEQKGEIRQTANIKSQEYDLNSWRFHQYVAIVILFPDLIEEAFPKYDPTEWLNYQAMGCGMLGMKDGQFYFLNKDLLDFYIVELVIKELRKKKLLIIGFTILARVLTSQKYRGIQIILNDAFEAEPLLLDNHEQRILDYIDDFYNMDNLEDYFINELEFFVKLIMKILENGSYEKVKELLTRTAVKLVESNVNLNIYLKFENVLFRHVNHEDLRTLIKEQEILLRIIQSEFKIEIFENLVTKLETMFEVPFIREVLMTKSTKLDGNIMLMMCKSDIKERSKVSKYLEIIQKYLTTSEIIELMRNCNENEETVLHVCVQMENEDLLKILWTEIRKLSDKQICKAFAAQKSLENQQTILHYAAISTNIEIHKELHQLIQDTFEDREELKNFMLQKDRNGNNFLHILVSTNKSEVIEISIKFIKENFSCATNEDILMKSGLNLLHIAAQYSKDVKTHQILWKVIRDISKSEDEIIKLIKNVNGSGNNVLHLAVSNSTNVILKFILNELEKIALKNEIKMLLSTSNSLNQNLLQLAAKDNKSMELHNYLWKIFGKYFEDSEIKELINHADSNWGNLMSIVNQFNSPEVIELTSKEVLKF